MKDNLWIAAVLAIMLAAAPVFGQNAGAPNVPANTPATSAQKLTPRNVHIQPLTMESISRQVNAQHAVFQAFEIRSALSQAGYTDPKLVQTVLDFLTTRTGARAPLRQQSAEFANLVSFKETPDTDISPKLQALRDAVKTEIRRSHSAILALDNQIHYSKDPRLEAILNTLGIFDDLKTFTSAGRLGWFDTGFAGGFAGPFNNVAGGRGGSGQGGSGAQYAPLTPGGVIIEVGEDGPTGGIYVGPDDTINGQPGPGVGVTLDLGSGWTATGNSDGGLTITGPGRPSIIVGTKHPAPTAGSGLGTVVLTPTIVKDKGTRQ